ncbi:hypothetical protein NKDENANG_02123 [Candidatus Entotheonellaceae bacterium PAL068K]
MQEISIRLPNLLDPRPRASRREAPLAPRPPTPAGTRLLLCDTETVRDRYRHLAGVVQQVVNRLQSHYGVQECRYLSRPHLRTPLHSVGDLAHHLATSDSDVALLALV